MQSIHMGLFMGQSNMAGRGVAARSPAVTPGMGYEFRAISAPEQLHPMQEPFGERENNPAGVYEPGMKTGSMVSAFTKACTGVTGTPIVGVSCAKGGSAIHQWVPGTPFYADAVQRAKACENYLTGQGCHIARKFMVWCQGCTDGDLHTPPESYKAQTAAFLRSLMAECGVEVCFLVQIGNHRDEPQLYVPIQQAQEELAREEPNVVLVSRQFKTFAARGLMKDTFHYLQEGYNLVGQEAGHAAGLWLASR